MISELFDAFIYDPLYNALAFIVGVIPGGDIGIAIVLLTVLVRILLFPISAGATRTQMEMQELNPQLTELKEKLKNNREELAKKTMELFKERKVNPFASIILVLIQIPIILGLYFVFRNEGVAGSFDPTLLYSFVSLPAEVSSLFLGLIDLTEKSLVLAVLVGVSQLFYSLLTVPAAPPKPTGNSFRDDMARSMNIQMRYVLPVVFGFIAYAISAAVALYFVASNIFGIVQTYAMKKMHHGHRHDN